jgi:hypothetical protein
MGCTKSIPVLNIHQEPKHEKYLKQGFLVIHSGV